MPYSPEAVANAFLGLARAEEKQLTNMQVQKLVFLAQGYSLAILGRCLYENNIHAWQWGPVIPRLYKALQAYGSGVVRDQLKADDEVPSTCEEYEVIQGVWGGYGEYSGGQLSALTHKPGSPWEKQWERKRFAPIPVEDIKDYYTALVEA